jgi:methylphosphotriester-DNA--protein-cysteine methyltransferase
VCQPIDFSKSGNEFSFFAFMLENLKIGPRYNGFLYLAESARNLLSIKSHHHKELELNLVVQGTISYVVAGRRFTFKRGTLLWLFPSQEHQLVDCSRDAKFFVAVFKRNLIARACHSADYDGLRTHKTMADDVLHAWLVPESFDLIRKTMNSLLEGAPDPDVLNREAGFGATSDFRFHHDDPDGLNAGLQHLLLLCWRSQRAGQALGNAVRLHPAVTNALSFLSESADDEDLTHLAQRCGASAAHLSRMFARQVGLPMSRYRNLVRLERFFEQYRGTLQSSITEAAYAAGFGSYAQFHRVFTQAYGKGPRECLTPRQRKE